MGRLQCRNIDINLVAVVCRRSRSCPEINLRASSLVASIPILHVAPYQLGCDKADVLVSRQPQADVHAFSIRRGIAKPQSLAVVRDEHLHGQTQTLQGRLLVKQCKVEDR